MRIDRQWLVFLGLSVIAHIGALALLSARIAPTPPVPQVFTVYRLPDAASDDLLEPVVDVPSSMPSPETGPSTDPTPDLRAPRQEMHAELEPLMDPPTPQVTSGLSVNDPSPDPEPSVPEVRVPAAEPAPEATVRWEEPVRPHGLVPSAEPITAHVPAPSDVLASSEQTARDSESPDVVSTLPLHRRRSEEARPRRAEGDLLQRKEGPSALSWTDVPRPDPLAWTSNENEAPSPENRRQIAPFTAEGPAAALKESELTPVNADLLAHAPPVPLMERAPEPAPISALRPPLESAPASSGVEPVPTGVEPQFFMLAAGHRATPAPTSTEPRPRAPRGSRRAVHAGAPIPVLDLERGNARRKASVTVELYATRTSGPAAPSAGPTLRPSPMSIEWVEEPAHHTGDLLTFVEPAYARSLRRRGVEGFIETRVHFDHRGHVTDWEIVRAEPDEAAFHREVARVVHRWRFYVAPAWNLLGIDPPPVIVRVEFKLDD